MRDPYEALGVSLDASPAEIKKAYRKLAKRYHPDSTGGDKSKEDRFKEVSTAYDVLGDPEKRARYDAMRKQGFPGPGGADGGGPGVDLGDLFAQMFGGAGPGGGGRGGGVRYRVYNSPGGFQNSAFGGESPLGNSPFDLRPGEQRRRRRRPNESAAEQRLRAADGSPLVQRGSDVHSDVRIDIDQAVLGTVAQVATLDGRASVKIPPGTSSGVKLRLKGRGPETSPGTRGDHFLTVQIDVPKEFDEEARRLLAAFMSRVQRRGGEPKS